jgi:hypothetical protein
MTAEQSAAFVNRIEDLGLLHFPARRGLRMIGGWLLPATEDRAQLMLQILGKHRVWRESGFRRMLQEPPVFEAMEAVYVCGEIWDGSNGFVPLTPESIERVMGQGPARKQLARSRDGQMAEAVRDLAKGKGMRRKTT